MKRRIIFLTAIAVVNTTACNQTSKKKVTINIYKARTYPTANNQFGYDILKDSVMVIHQPIIPGLQGNKGFSSKEDAQRVANLMIYKLAHGLNPPSITVKELDSLTIR